MTKSTKLAQAIAEQRSLRFKAAVAAGMVKRGMNKLMLAKALGIARQTLNKWMSNIEVLTVANIRALLNLGIITIDDVVDIFKEVV